MGTADRLDQYRGSQISASRGSPVTPYRGALMASKKRAGILAAAVVAAVGFGTMGHTAQAATVNPPETVEYPGGFPLRASLASSAITCTDPAAGTWTANWTLNVTTDAPGLTTTLASATAGGLTPETKIGSATTNVVPRTSFTGAGSYTGTATITQTVVYSTSVTVNTSPTPLAGTNTTLTATVDSPCLASAITTPTTTTTLAPTTTVAPTTTQAAAVTTQALATTTTAKATTTTKAAVLAASALPSTGSNSGTLIAVGLAFGIAGITLVRMDRKRKLYA
jgi:LPXTG-motif cell wall-anchored protein